jgi:hypothetical protein
MDPILGVAEFTRVGSHNPAHRLDVFTDFLEHFPFGCNPDFLFGFSLPEIAGQGFLTDDVFPCLGGVQDHGKVKGIGNNQVYDRNGFVFQDIPKIVKDLGNSMAPGQVFGPGLVNVHDRGDLYRNPLDLPVAAQMKGGRETRPHYSDFYFLGHRILSFPERDGLGKAANHFYAKISGGVCQGKR